MWAALDDAVADPAQKLVPGKFRTRARTARERVHPQSVEQRHARAAKDRVLHITHEADGMSSLFALIPSVKARMIEERLDGDARHLSAHPGEPRTLAQLRADTVCDLLTGHVGAGDEQLTEPTAVCPTGRVTTVVHLTIPVLTLLGHPTSLRPWTGSDPSVSTTPDTSRQAPTNGSACYHPVTGTFLDVERRAYRVPKSLRRWLAVTYPTCVFPGCPRPASRCDIDHRKRWADGGATAAANLAPQCRAHHPVKDETLWNLTRHPETGGLTWHSPTGYTTRADPPPF